MSNMARRLKKSKIRGNFFNKEKSLYKGNMRHRAILSHKLRKFFRKANLASNASGAPNCPFHKSGKQGIWRAICEKSSAALRLFRLVEAPAPIPKHAEFFCGYAPSRC